MIIYDGLCASVRGASHVRSDMECQDYSAVFAGKNYAVCVVCDGHGGTKHFRSAEGAKIAVDIAENAIKKFVVSYTKSQSNNNDELLLQLKKNIIYLWNEEITSHYDIYPFMTNELERLDERDKRHIQNNVESAYGTTLIAVVITDRMSFGIQIGDGDCVCQKEDGTLVCPIPEDENLIFNITTSLCSRSALKSFRHFWSDEPFVSALVSTDGVKNSFSNENYYLDFCKTVIQSLHDDGGDIAENELIGFLESLTNNGSGDDVSISAAIKK